MALTVRQVEAAKPADKAYKLADGACLYLFVAPSGLRRWRANYQQDAKQKTRTYGRYPDMTLAQARAAHRAAKGGCAKKPAKATAPSFKEESAA